MDDSKKHRDENLPVTAEVGAEGGSFADATYQKSALDGPEGLPRESDPDQPDTAGDVPQYAEHRGQIADGGVGTDPGPADGMKKYPTD